MINKTMMEQEPKKDENVNDEVVKPTEPNEKIGFVYSSSIKITDTDSGKILLQMRCD